MLPETRPGEFVRVAVGLILTPWRDSRPPGMILRDWVPEPVGELPTFQCNGEPGLSERGLRGAAAAVRDEGRRVVCDGEVVKERWSWRIWTPIGHNWPYRAGDAATVEAAQVAADEALAELGRKLGTMTARHLST